VIHMAAQVDVRRAVRDPIEDADINILGTLSVYEAARAAGTQTVLVASSGGTIYGEPRRFPVSESARSRPTTPYGIGKRVLHDYAAFYMQTYGIRSVLLALGNGVVAIFLGRMLRGEIPIIYGDGTQVRDYIFVDDVVEAFVRSMDSKFAGGVNIGTGTGTSVLELFGACAHTVGYKGKPAFEPPRTGELERSILDVGLAARELGWKPKARLLQGLKRTAAYLSDGR
jgi:UDP-glucose 4-epimerase